MPASRYFLEVPAGSEMVARAELQRLGAKRLAEFPGGFRLVQDADLAKALRARMVAAAYLSMTFPVPRPKALLGDANFRALVTAVKGIAARGEYGGLRLSAAGADSPTMTRLAAALAAAVGLPWRQDDGELLVRLRPDPATTGWEVLVRLTPRPSSTRAWRVCNRPGGLNAAVAAVMNELAGVDARDTYLNLMCGSGTLLIERALRAPARRLVGFDIDPDAVRCAETNAAAASVVKRCELTVGDLTDPRFVERLGAAGRFDVMTADAPWGDAVGAHAANRALYPKLFAAAAALGAPDSRFCLLSHELRLLRSVVGDQPWWQVERESQVAHGGHHPLVLVMSRVQE